MKIHPAVYHFGGTFLNTSNITKTTYVKKTDGDAEAKAPILWPPDAKSRLTGKDPDAGKDWRQEKKGMTEDEMAGWHHQLDVHELG